MEARDKIAWALNNLDWGKKTRCVRINDVTTEWCHGDIITLVEKAGDRLDTIMLTKPYSAADVIFLDRMLGQLEKRLKLERRIGIEVLILSSEPNRVVEARARKMGVEAVHGVGLHEKGHVMREILQQKNLKAENVVFIGNDINDLPCFAEAGWSVAVADAFPEVLRAADFALSKNGGHGALRELCDLILNRTKKP